MQALLFLHRATLAAAGFANRTKALALGKYAAITLQENG
jgi:hypothetical protein